MITTPLQELTQKIHKHCPELLELSFGCHVHHSSFDGTFIAVDSSGFIVVAVGIPRYKAKDIKSFGIEIQTLEILGHPITLEHVLKAMRLSIKPLKERRENLFFNVQESKIIYSYVDDVLMTSDVVGETWHLTKPLSEQSPETIEWLNKIIV